MALYDLSKLEVIDILTTFEEKLPNKGIEFFEPSWNFNPRDVNSIHTEAGRMVRFMGLEGYIPIIMFSNLSHAAGNAQMGNTGDNVWEITIDNNTLRDNAFALRVLAHEISHKFLEHYGIYSKGTNGKLDECQAELCTIYMGLGLLTLNAYNEHSGYLNLEDFTHAFCAVYKARGMSEEEICNKVPTTCKQYVLQFFNDMVKGNLFDVITQSQRSDYEFRRRIRLLQLIFDSIPEFQERHRRQDAIVRGRPYDVHDKKHPISRMLLMEVLHQNNLIDSRLDTCNKEIDKLLVKLCKTLPVNFDSINKGLTENITCPCCGHIFEQPFENKTSTVVCHKCQHYFAWDATPFVVPTTFNRFKVGISILWQKIKSKYMKKKK